MLEGEEGVRGSKMNPRMLMLIYILLPVDPVGGNPTGYGFHLTSMPPLKSEQVFSAKSVKSDFNYHFALVLQLFKTQGELY